MEDDKNNEDDRFSDVKRIRNYKVLQISRRQAVRVTFEAESMKVPGSMFSIVCMDIANTTDLEKNVFLNEIRIFASIKHPFILHYYESFVDKKLGLLW